MPSSYTSGTKNSNEDANSKPSGVSLMDMPTGSPKPHESRKWGIELDSALVTLGLTCVARNRLPAGKFPRLWSEAALMDPPPLPAKPSFKDILSHRSLTDEIEKRKSFNATTIEQRSQSVEGKCCCSCEPASSSTGMRLRRGVEIYSCVHSEPCWA